MTDDNLLGYNKLSLGYFKNHITDTYPQGSNIRGKAMYNQYHLPSQKKDIYAEQK